MVATTAADDALFERVRRRRAALSNAEKTTVKFRTVLLTLFIGNRLSASLLFFGLFCGIFVAQNGAAFARLGDAPDANGQNGGAAEAVAKSRQGETSPSSNFDAKGALGERRSADSEEGAETVSDDAPNASYSNNDKTRKNAAAPFEPNASLKRADEPLALGRRAFERGAEKKTERGVSADAAGDSDASVAGGAAGEPSVWGVPSASADGAPRLVRQNVYSGNVVFYELSNGLKILLKKTNDSRVGIRVALRDAGTLGEREAAGSGIAALTAALVVEKANASGAVGSRFWGRAGREETVLGIDVLQDEASAALATTADAIWRSTFDEERVARAVRLARRRVETSTFDRERCVDNLTAETVYLASPFREPIDGRLERLEALTAADVQAFYSSRYAPNRASLAIAGPLEPAETLGAIVARCRGVARSAPFGTAPPTEPRQTGVRDAFVEGAGTTGTLVLAWPAVERSDPDAAAFEILAEILTGGVNARLTRKVVDGEIPALVVAARARLPFDVRGFFEIRAEIAPENWPVVEAAVRAELRRLAEEPITNEEAEAAKKRFEMARALRERNPIASLEARATALAATGDPDFEARRAEAIRRVDAATLQRVVRERIGDVFSRIAILPKGAAPHLVVPERVDPSPFWLTTRSLKNGLRVVEAGAADDRLIDVRFVALAGALVETRETAGQTALLGEMLDKGSARFSRSEVARFFDSIGARFETRVDRDTISFGATVLKEDFEKTFEILLDAATNPRFDREEFERAKTRRLAALAKRSGSAEETLDEIFAQAVPEESAFSTPIEGTAETIAATTLDDLRAFWRQVFSTQNLLVSFDGGIEGTAAKSEAAARLEAIPANPNFRPIDFDRPNEPPQPIRRFKLARSAPTGAAILASAIPGPAALEDRAALLVLETIWEGPFGSAGRLGERFAKDFDGRCEFRVDLTEGPAPGYMTVRWTTEPENLPEASRRVLGTITATVKSSISEEECARAKKQIAARQDGRYVDLKERTSRLVLDELYRVAPTTPPTKRRSLLQAALERTTAADVRRVALKYWGEEPAVWAIVSPIPFPGVEQLNEDSETRAP